MVFVKEIDDSSKADIITKVVSEQLKINPKQIFSTSRTAPVVQARMIICFLLKMFTRLPYIKISQAIGRTDHSTSFYHHKQCIKKMSYNLQLYALVISIGEKCSNQIDLTNQRKISIL